MIKRETEFQPVYASPSSWGQLLQFPTERPTVTFPFGMLLQKPSSVPGRTRFILPTPPAWMTASMGAGDEHSLPLIVRNQRRQHLRLEQLIIRKFPWYVTRSAELE